MLKKIKYIFHCIFKMDYKGLFKTVGIAHRDSGKSRIFLFFDIVYCGLKYGAGYNDYIVADYYNLNKEQRKTYITRSINQNIAKRLNNSEYYHYFRNKNEFYQTFCYFIGRDYIYIPESSKEDFIGFMRNRDEIIIKPANECGGVGVEKLNKNDFDSIDAMYDYVCAHADLVDEVLVQHEALNRLNPSCVNTIRVVTIYNNSKVNIAFARIRIGCGDKPIDNVTAGGMCAPVDIETGVITHVGYSKSREEYKCHPVTGCPIEGFEIPMWDKVLDICTRAGYIIPQVGYTGWDVAITPTGPVLIEGNCLPGHLMMQMPPHLPDKIGMLPTVKKYIDL